ncbi:hypothetical protein B7P43_G09582 [Cryptotermes secundus]|uniref:Nuclear pore complex protein Nup153 n=1 Tax=Cryptotermes secundus TaxID=105785 RepID=A0A2J7RQ69_9NEOP|nr:nuclear pore complex protein Nup153 isoform X2 [Cryptotermes secundus]PNF42978.1 hypothetical protein B7P43_G09582 [Cryptotermes secundus]
MAKGSSGLRKKKLHSSKPYDVSNSFVKKVTSRVTNLLPQPAWLSKWFTASVDAVNSNDSGSEDDDDDTANMHTHPVKRAKIELNQPFPPNSFKVSTIGNDQVSSQQASTLRIVQDDSTDGAVAGPSGVSTRQLISSTPNIRSTGSHLLASAGQKMNGDDQSEGSESTSGCSSVPQANRQMGAGGESISSLLGRRRSMDEKLNFTGHLQRPRSLFSDRSHSRSPHLNSPVKRRNPSFNASAFGSPLVGKDNSSSKSTVISSPFYTGRTTYGGASAYRATRNKTFIHSEAVSRKDCGVQIKPVNCVPDPLSSMSTAAYRILEALERLSTPVLDAKRIPLEPSPPPLSNKRKRLHGTDLRLGQAPHTPKSACGLTIPTVPDLLKMKHHEKLQDSSQSAPPTATSSAPSNFNHEYKLRFEDDGKEGRHVGKIRGKVKELEEGTVEAVNLPHISLPLTSVPKFDFVVPPAADMPAGISTFKFASPIIVKENARTCLPNDNFALSDPLSAVGNKKITVDTKSNCDDTSIPNCPTKLSGVQFVSRSDNKKNEGEIASHKNSNDGEMCFGIKRATKRAACGVMDIQGKKPYCTDKAELKEVDSSSISLDKLKPAPEIWECGDCMIHNRIDDTKCLACKAPRTSAGSLTSTAASTPECPRIQVSASDVMWECSSCHVHNLYSATVCSKCLVARTEGLSHGKNSAHPAMSVNGSGRKFKPSETWECGTCAVRNRNSLKHCHACETRRPVLAATRTPVSTAKPTQTSVNSTLELGFGDKFKKPPGSWDCPDCMLQNKSESLHCVACQKVKPGSESQSPINLIVVLDKAGVSVKESNNASSSNLQSICFGETKVIPVTTISFLVTQASETKSVTLATKPTQTSPAQSTVGMLFGDGFKKTSGMWNCSKCMVQNNSDTLKCVACGGARPGSELHSAMKVSFGIDKAGVPVKESDSASSSNMQFFTFTEPKVTSDSMPKTTEACTLATASTGFSFGPAMMSPSASETVVKPADTSSLSQTAFSFGIPQHSQFQPPASSEDQKLPGGDPKKRRSSEVKDDIANKAMFSFNGSSFTSENPNTSTEMVQSAKSNLSFGATLEDAASTDINMSLVEPAAAVPSIGFTSPQAAFGSSTVAAVTASSNIDFGIATCTPAATVTTASGVFNFGATSPCVTFGGSSQQSASTSGITNEFGTALKTDAPTMFTFNSNVSNMETVGATTSNTQVPSFVPIMNTATNTAFGPLTATATMSPSLSSFASATTAPNFGLGARETTPAFGTPNTTINSAITTSPTFGSFPAPNFNTGFSAIHEQKPLLPDVTMSTATPVPFTFGSSLGQAAPYAFDNVQNDQGLANKGTFTFGSASTPASNSGFSFGSSNQVPFHVGPAYNFGSSEVTTSSTVIPSMFQAAGPASGNVFGASSSVFGANNSGNSNPAPTTAAGPSPSPFIFGSNPAPTTASGPIPCPFKFGSSSSQPSSNVFGFTANQPTGSTNVPVQNFTSPASNFTSPASNFTFNQSQPAAQSSSQPVGPTFDPSIRPTFNFSKGETPSFTATAAGDAVRPERRFKKALRRTHPR